MGNWIRFLPFQGVIRSFMNGRLSLGITSLVPAIILTVALLIAVGWTTLQRRSLALKIQTQEVRDAAQWISHYAQTTLERNDLASLRQFIAEVVQKYQLTRCSVSLSDGQVIADSDPTKVTANSLPAAWETRVTEASDEFVGADQIVLRRPFTVSGRGDGSLRLEARVGASKETGSSGHWFLFIVVGLALGSGAVTYLWVQPRLRVMEAVRSGVLANKEENTPIDLFRVSATFGPEAVAWNQFLNELQKLRDKEFVSQGQVKDGSSPSRSARLDEVCDTMSQGLVLIDEHSRVQYANGAAAVFLGKDRKTLVQSPVDQAIQDPNVLKAVGQALDEKSRLRTVLESQKAGEDEGADSSILRFNIRPIRHDNTQSAAVLIEDITQQRVAELSRNDFVSQVAHELRNPLTNVRLYVEALLNDNPPPEEQSKFVNIINGETRRLERLVNDMLSVAEIEAGTMTLKRDDVHLDKLIEDLRKDFDSQAKEKEIALTFNLPPKVPVIQADRDKLLMALHNVVGNAVKYTPNKGRVDVSVEFHNDHLAVEVRDTGIGIKKPEIKRVFEKFYRAKDDQLAGIPGTGLGLPMAREMMRLHGGDITVESEHGKGSAFTLTCPVGQPT